MDISINSGRRNWNLKWFFNNIKVIRVRVKSSVIFEIWEEDKGKFEGDVSDI